MAIITISRGSYTKGREIAEKTAQKLGYGCISREILLQASRDYDIPEVKLTQAIEDAPSFLDRFSREREKYIAYIQAALLNELKKDNVVYHGFASYFFIKDIPQVLKVRIISKMEDRVAEVTERNKVSTREALRIIKKVDEQRKRWGLKLYGYDSSDPGLYDLLLHIDRITVEDAVAVICQIAGLRQFQITAELREVLEDLAIAAQVKTYLVDVKPAAEVCIDNGFVSLKTGAQVTPGSELVKKLGLIVKMVPAVKGIKVVTEVGEEDRQVCLPEPDTASSSGVKPAYFTELG